MLCFSEKEKGKISKDYMERIKNEEHYWIMWMKMQ